MVHIQTSGQVIVACQLHAARIVKALKAAGESPVMRPLEGGRCEACR